MSEHFFLKIFIIFYLLEKILSAFSLKSTSIFSSPQPEKKNQPKLKILNLNDSFNISTYNFTEYDNYCQENIHYNLEQCYQYSTQLSSFITKKILESLEQNSTINNENITINNSIINETDKKHIANIYYNLGKINYFGLGQFMKNPSLHLGLSYFLISSFLGSPESKYKLSIILSNNLFEQIYRSKDFQKLINSDNNDKNKVAEISLLKKIFETDFIQKNFIPLINLTDPKNYNIKNNTNNLINKYKNLSRKEITQKVEELHSQLATTFLYSSALQNYLPAKKLLAYKFFKGYGVKYSCNNAIKYYIDVSKDILKEFHLADTKVNYDFVSLENYEYIGNKFKEDNIKDQKSVVDLYWTKITNKKDDLNLQIIKELGKIYYYGLSGVKQNFETSFFLFNKAVSLNDNESMFFLGEQYLHGWGIEKNYTKAFELFNKSIVEYNNSYSWNSLGYMYYYGYGVEKNLQKAFEHFTVGITNGDSDAYFDKMFLLVKNQEKNKKETTIDYNKAYKYASVIAAKDLTFGNYFYAMMNQYSIGSMLSSCDININFFKSIAEHSFYNKHLYDLAINFYRNKMFKKAFLIYMELAESGASTAQINAALLLENYQIFSDKSYQKFMTYKYFLMSYKEGNSLASIKLGDIFYGGFGSLKQNIKQAKKFYKESKTLNILLDKFQKSHADFNLGMIYMFKENSSNITNDTYVGNIFFNKSQHHEKLAYYPGEVAKLYNRIFRDRKENLINIVLENTLGKIFNKGIFKSVKFYFVLINIILYLMFYVSIKYQKD